MSKNNWSENFATQIPPNGEGINNTRHTSLPPDLSIYSLTIGEASLLMHSERCRFASNRKVQRMCQNGVIDCYKLQTTRNGQPVSEWLVNDTSLRTHIDEKEIKWDDDDFTPPPVNGNASRAPIHDGDATTRSEKYKSTVVAPDTKSAPNESGDASGATKTWGKWKDVGDAMATPREDGNAIGETRSLASLLIENARLTAELEGARQLVGEVRNDREFLREELKEARAGRKDVTAIAERMLETLETIAIGGKLMPRNPNDSDKRNNATFIERAEVDASDQPDSNSHRGDQAQPTGDNQTDEIDRFDV